MNLQNLIKTLLYLTLIILVEEAKSAENNRLSVEHVGDKITVSWFGKAGMSYDILVRSAFSPQAAWIRPPVGFYGIGNNETIEFAITADKNQEFYLLEARPFNPLPTEKFYRDPNSNAAQQAKLLQTTRPDDAILIQKIAREPQAIWLGEWISNVRDEVQRVCERASIAETVPVFVAYGVPLRDCSSYSGGGAKSNAAYTNWVGNVARGISAYAAVVILEPDALASLDCLSKENQDLRLTLLREAVRILKEISTRVVIYIDCGHARWQPVAVIAERLNKVGIDEADGFSLNVSNFVGDSENIRYGKQVSALVGDKHFVIDSSRNGKGPAPNNEWCNPPGRALGKQPTGETGEPLLDAFLWIKRPGESDGTCHGGPSAGRWWLEYALGLAERASY